MEEQFVLRVPPSVAERIESLLNENGSSSDDKSLDLSFSEDGRNGSFVIGNDRFPASLLDLPCIAESYKTYDDSVLSKLQTLAKPDAVEYRHGLTPPMRDARRRRFRREPDLNPELVQRVERDLLNIMAGGTAENIDILGMSTVFLYALILDARALHVEVDGDENARSKSKKAAPPAPPPKPDVPAARANAVEPDGSDSDESDDSV
ncbi:hypothetical protein C3L33_15259, partial [Rhododendron williamsianum]